MALVLKDRVKETTTTTGTGTVTLAGAATGFQSFSAIGDGNATYYTIALQNGSEWEVGIGTYTASGTTLSRTTVLESSNSGSLVNFSAGDKDVFVTYPAERASITYTGVKTSNYTAGPNEGVLTSTSGGAFTVTLPASPAANMQVTVADTATSWGTNNLTIGRNGSTIAGLAEDLVCDIDDISVNLIYTGTTWEVYAVAVSNNTNIGYKNVPQSGSDKTTSYSLVTTDVGKFVGVGSGGSITIPNSTFSAGDVVSIFNNTTGNVTITCSITTAYIAGTDTDKSTMTLATRGVATVLFISGTVCVVSGNVS